MKNPDPAILNYIRSNMRNDFCDRVMPIISKFGDGGALWFGMSASLCFSNQKNKRKNGVAMLTALGLNAISCNLILKPYAKRERPFDALPDITLLIKPPTDYSFPSGHTSSSFASAFSLFFGKNKLWKPSVVMASLIAYSRVYLHVHYPTDILAGATIGTVNGWLANFICDKAEIKLKEKKNRP